MTLFDVITLLGGIGLFLYGMSIMGTGLEKVAGGKMQSILQKLTSSVLRGVLLGAFITAIIQSSAGTIVIVVGLVNSGIMALPQAVGVIMGANIGTTITGQIIRMADISGDSLLLTLLKPTTFSPIVAFIGAVLFVFFKKPSQKNIGQIMMGFGILFTGMSAMDTAVAPLKDSQLFMAAFTSMENPVLGCLAGVLATVAIQSSSASVGLLQALTSTGLVTWGSSFPIIMGTHIGTAFTPLIASTGASKDAKRAAFIHLYFNLIGSIIMLVVVCTTNYFVGLPFWDSVMNKGSIANVHSFSSIIAVLFLLPFSGGLLKLAEKTVRDRSGEMQDMDLPVLDERLFKSPAVAIQQARSAVAKMAQRAGRNFHLCTQDLQTYNPETAGEIARREELIDKMEVSISNYLVKINEQQLNEREVQQTNQLFSFITEFERIGDYSINLMEIGRTMWERDLAFTETARQELSVLVAAVSEAINLAAKAFRDNDLEATYHLEPLEDVVDQLCETLRTDHINRLKEGKCEIRAGIQYLDAVTQLERISDHCSNIAARILGWEYGYEDLDMHRMKRELHRGAPQRFARYRSEYENLYCSMLSLEDRTPAKVS